MCASAKPSNARLPNCGRRPSMTKPWRLAATAASTLSRRGFLAGMAGAGVVLGYTRITGTEAATELSPGAFDPTVWYEIDGRGIVTVNIIRAEMGQHIGTA